MPISDHALHNVRLLVNIAKVTMCTLIRVGSELALDEEYVASWLLCGRAMIFFNPMNSCGKFHFHF
jgi:hypothetical protein